MLCQYHQTVVGIIALVLSLLNKGIICEILITTDRDVCVDTACS